MGIKTEIPVCVGVRRFSECVGEDVPILEVECQERGEAIGLK